MSGPRYGGRGRSKCMIRNETLIDEGQNRFKRAPRQTPACARRASTLGASPRASGRQLGPGGPPPSPQGPPDRRAGHPGRARVGAAAAAADATHAAGYAELQAQTSSSPCSKMQLRLRLWLSGWRMCALCERGQWGKGRKGRVRHMLLVRWQVGAEAECCGC
jgi:hypothetical protein